MKTTLTVDRPLPELIADLYQLCLRLLADARVGQLTLADVEALRRVCETVLGQAKQEEPTP